MYRLTARLLLVLLLVGTFAPAAMAISAPAAHACCARKAVHDHGSGGSEMQAVDGQRRTCCPPVTKAHWAELGSGVDATFRPILATLPPDSHPVLHSDYFNALRPVRGPPLS